MSVRASLSWLALIASFLFVVWICSPMAHSASKPDPIPPSSVSPGSARIAVINAELVTLQRKLESLDTSSKLNSSNKAQWCANFRELYAIAARQVDLITELEGMGAGSMSHTVWKTTIKALLSAKTRTEAECKD